jgi:glutathione transport system ATP-binding protein
MRARAMPALGMSSDSLLAVHDLAVRFGRGPDAVHAVDGLSFEVGRGETVAIVGESGSGKSVTALSVLRLIELGGGRIEGGEILFNRPVGSVADLATASDALMREVRGAEISMIFQEPMTSLNPVFPVGEQIAEAVRLHQELGRAEARETALDMLRRVRIADPGRIFDRYPHQLSGGMRQRVMIAMALACRPALLLADEPTTALDVTIQAQILALIRTLQAELGMAVVFITHDMAVVAEMAERVVVMRTGRAVEEGPVGEIFARPNHPYTRSLLAAVPRLGSMRGKTAPEPFPTTEPGHGSLAILPVPDREAPPLLRVGELTTRFDLAGGWLGRVQHRVHAVEGVSFEIRPGETLALVGESGCGKSTVVRSIAGLVMPEAGTIELDGKGIDCAKGGDFRPIRQQAQIVFQDPFGSLDPRLTVGFTIAEPLLVNRLSSKRVARDRVSTLLTMVGLSPDHAGRYPHEFSGGQRQRIAIARALATEPKLVIADEAVSALDVSIRAQIINLLMELQSRLGLAYLFISHDIALVERIAHRVAVMYLGQIVELGTRRDVFEEPAHPYTRRLLAAVPVADPARRRPDRAFDNTELPSSMRPIGMPPFRHVLRPLSETHFVVSPEGAP